VEIALQTWFPCGVDFAVLGPIEVTVDGRALILGGPKQRALLAMLLLEANRPVSRDRLVDGLWGPRPPPTAQRSLDSYVSRLRALLGVDRIAKRAPGYVVRVEPGELDLDRFEDIVERSRAASLGGDFSTASRMLDDALALWRGAALADLVYEPFARLETDRLEERRLLALEERIAADLELGGGAALVPELEALVREHPFRERQLAQLMLALYRAGRQSDALAVFRSARQRFAEQLGLEPGTELQELQRRILERDPALAGARRRPLPVPRHGWKLSGLRRLAVAAAGAVLVAATGIAVWMESDGGGNAPGAARSSGLVALSAAANVRDLGVASTPAAMATGDGGLWLADPGSGAVSHVDLTTGRVVDRVPVGSDPGAIAIGGGSIWSASVPGGEVDRIDPDTGSVTQKISLGAARASALAFGSGGLWIADLSGSSLIELDPASGKVRRTLALDARPTSLAIDRGTIWVASYDRGTVEEVDLRRGETVATVHVGNGPAALAVARGAVWVANALDSTVSKVDVASGAVVATIPVGSGPTALAVEGGAVWVASEYAASVSRIDPARDVVAHVAAIDGAPTTLAGVDGTVYAGLRPLVQHRGGRLVLLHTRPISIDPALQFDLLPLQSDALTRDGLVTYNHVSGPGGIRLVPDLAVSLPTPTDGGTTYTFRLRPGIRYSDGRLVRAADYRRAIERVFRLGSQGSHSFASLVGVESCERFDSTCDLARGIVADETARTVTFHLRSPDPDLLINLAGPFAAPVPPGTPFRNTGFSPIPGTGPYKVATASDQEIRYVRNPFFREWSHAARPDGNPDEIVMRFGLTPAREIREVQAGRADWSADNVPSSLLPEIRTRFPGQAHRYAIPETDFFQFNTALPPFDDVRVRRALNLAIDRRVAVRLDGGSDLASPACQILPPGEPGYRHYCPYARNLARAERLVTASGTRGTLVTVWGWTDDPTLSPNLIRYVAGVLHQLGYVTRVRLVPHSFLDHPPTDIFTRIQLIPAGWEDTPHGFFATWFGCEGTNSHGWFCDRWIDRQIRQAQLLESSRPQAADAAWARIDRELVDQAAWVPIVNQRGIDFVSARVRNYQFHPYWGLIADQLWLA
jgi:YVTN family beta-propeller protein